MSVHHQRRSTYPVLSPTFQSHQLWSPFHLDRITINTSKYHGYLTHSMKTNPPHLNAISRRNNKYGDNGFFLHKDIPVQQFYDRTAFKRSEVRSCDQTIPKPMITSQVLSKESGLPFPSQHPYTSHISQFSVFPDTRKDFNAPLYHQVDTSESNEPTSEEEDGSIQEENFKETAIQTDLSCLKFEHSSQPATQPKAPSYIIREKAFSNGIRIEKEIAASDQTESKPIPTSVTPFALRPGVYRWDISRSQSLGHQRSMTYPAPTTIFSPKNHYLSALSPPLNPTTYQALLSVNHRMSTSTTYKEHFSPLPASAIREAHRPFSSYHQMSDSRGKYARAPNFANQNRSGSSSIKTTPFADNYVVLECESDSEYGGSTTRKVFSNTLSQSEVKNETAISHEIDNKKRDQATQTDPEWETEEEDWHDHEHECETDIREETKIKEPPQFLLPQDSIEGSYLRPSTASSSSSQASYLSEGVLQVPYSKMEALRQFRLAYPDHVPDLREYSIRSGRRHVINGYHAYYWH